jgi:hypothetical protein
MADVKFRTTRFQLDAGANGTQYDVTIPGMGFTPKAALFFLNRALSDDTLDNVAVMMSTGFSDGTNSRATGFDAAGGQASSRSYRSFTTNAVTAISTTDPALRTYIDVNTFIPDGVTLEVVNSTGGARHVTVVFIGGDDVTNALVHTVDAGTGTSEIPVNIGFEPTLVFATGLISTAAQGDAAFTDGRHHFGVCVNDGSQTQRSYCFHDDHNVTETNVGTKLSNQVILNYINNGASEFGTSITSFNATGFGVTPNSSSANYIQFFLSVEIANSPDVALFDTSIPTSGNYVENVGFQPEFGLILSAAQIGLRNADANDSSVMGHAVTTFDASEIYTQNNYSESAQSAVSVVGGMSSQYFRVLSPAGGSDYAVASGYSLTATGWDFTLTTHPTSPLLGFGLAIGPGAAADFADTNTFTITITASGPTLLEVQELSQAQTLDATVLTQHNVLAVAELAQAQTLDNVDLGQGAVLDVQELAQSTLLDNVLLTQAGILLVDDLTQATRLANTDLIQQCDTGNSRAA